MHFGIHHRIVRRNQNGAISHELDKIRKAQQSLKLLEQRCTTTMAAATTTTTKSTTNGNAITFNDNRELAVQAHFQPNWLSHVRYKIFGNVIGVNVNNNMKVKSMSQLIEEQIILGECYMLNAILLFLMQDITG